MNLIIPAGYASALDIRQTEIAIKDLKDYFQSHLAGALHLTRVSAPLFVFPETGLNDDLNGVERPVSFGVLEQGDRVCQVVHSLAKWKRYALKRYAFAPGEGIYTDMNAIRRDETTDNIHSLYVDQWDWEKIITRKERNLETLRQTVRTIYGVIRDTQRYVSEKYACTDAFLPQDITFITTQEMEDAYPQLSPGEREDLYTKKYGAIFLMQIGGKLKSGKIHDGRAPDYDDWSLNGDILLHYPLFDKTMEVSSMGIRVDESALKNQLAARDATSRARLPFCQAVLKGELPLTIGGGIGQSRICMFMLGKAHIGEVQSSVWPEETISACEAHGIHLL